MTLQELIRGIPGGRVAAAPGEDATPIRTVVHRAEEAGPGALFCALRGLRADGHDFAAEAVARGAAALMVERAAAAAGAPGGRARHAPGRCALAAAELSGRPVGGARAWSA